MKSESESKGIWKEFRTNSLQIARYDYSILFLKKVTYGIWHISLIFLSEIVK